MNRAELGGMDRSGRPVVTLSYAQTLDGRLATRSGSSRWISGEASLRLTHQLRADHDAIMVGVGTVLTDDPRLTVRLAAGRDPLRIVVDSQLRTPLSSAVLRDGAAHGTLLVTTERASPGRRAAIETLGAGVLAVPAAAGGRVDLVALLVALGQREIGSVMVEGGAGLITALLRERLADRVAITVAPKILGCGIAAVGDLQIDDLERACLIDRLEVSRYGDDLVLSGDLRYPDGDDV